MQIAATYSHLYGEDVLVARHPELWKEVKQVIAAVDVSELRTKVSNERAFRVKRLYSPVEMNKAFKAEFSDHGWQEWRDQNWLTVDSELTKDIYDAETDQQKSKILRAGLTPIQSYNQVDFVKGRVAIEVQFGKYAFVAHDIFVKHRALFAADIIDVAIEIVPMKELEMEMSSGVPYYERDMTNLVRGGWHVPDFPLVLVGIAP